MITGELKSKIDKLWEQFWTGGITNPLTVIEQISYLLYIRNLDYRETINERKAKRSKDPDSVQFIFGEKEKHLRWKNLMQISKTEELRDTMQHEVFPHIKTLGRGTSHFNEYMKDAIFMIQKPALLYEAMQMIDKLPIDHADTKGDLYEYLLSKLTTAGINGQFRTPRHIIDMMVEFIDPKSTDRICDPACGTGGFLVRSYEYLRRKYTSKKGEIQDDEVGVIYSADKLSAEERHHLHHDMFHGFDFDSTMLRIGSMNLMLHNLENPNIFYCDTLSNAMPERYKDYSEDCFDIILANPPFKGSLDESDVHDSITKKIKTKKTELLFLILIWRMLKLGGRCAVVVPDGVLFGSSKAHKGLRQFLVENNQLEAVISLPSGVFKPYAGVSTAILMFTKGDEQTEKQTDNVFFYDVQADGFSLDDKRNKIDENDLPDVLAKWHDYDHGKNLKDFEDRTQKAFYVTREDIAEQDYDLSIGRYKEHVYEEVVYEKPKVIIKQLKQMEKQIMDDLNELEEMLR